VRSNIGEVWDQILVKKNKYEIKINTIQNLLDGNKLNINKILIYCSLLIFDLGQLFGDFPF